MRRNCVSELEAFTWGTNDKKEANKRNNDFNEAVGNYETKTLAEVKKGEYFRIKENGKVYVRDDYDRSEKKYGYYDFDDVNNYHLSKGSKAVQVGFTF